MSSSNYDAERSVLGGILLDGQWQLASELADVAAPGDFHGIGNRLTYEAMQRLAARRQPIDRVTVKAELEAAGCLGRVGGDEFVDLLDTVVPTAANIGYYANIVREKAIQRRLQEAAADVAKVAADKCDNLGELLDYAERKILAATKTISSEEPPSARDAVRRAMTFLQGAYERGGQAITGIQGGVPGLDRLLAGYHDGELIILAARPSHGKSALGFQIAQQAAIDHGAAVGIFSLEMPETDTMLRMKAQRARIDFTRLRTGSIRENEWARLAKVAGEIAAAPLHVDDTTGATLASIRAKARRLRAKYKDKPLLICVDYLQLVRHKAETREQEIAQTAQGLKELARELKCPVLALCQLNRGVEKRDNKRPCMADLRGSGELEQHTDVIVFIHHPHGHASGNPEVELIVEKQRNGPLGDVPVMWVPQYVRFDAAA